MFCILDVLFTATKQTDDSQSRFYSILKTWTNNKSLKRLVLVNKLDFTEDLPKQLGTGITSHGKKI